MERIADIELAHENALADHEVWKISGHVPVSYAFPEGVEDDDV